MSDNHLTKKELAQLHKPGACVVRHQPRTEGHLCSHQWQARVKAESDSKLYNFPAYESLCGRGFMEASVRRTEKGVFPWGYAEEAKGGFRRKRPTRQGKEWDLGVDNNFNHFIKPYWHNAHHIIPNGSLKAAITKTAEADERLPRLIVGGLFKAKYNLNDKVNMVILPMEKVVARALKLPRHLIGDDPGPGGKPELYSHVDYSNQVTLKLDDIMKEYKQVLAKTLETKKKHPPLPNDLSKQKLIDLSESIYQIITGVSRAKAGAPLSALDLSDA